MYAYTSSSIGITTSSGVGLNHLNQRIRCCRCIAATQNGAELSRTTFWVFLLVRTKLSAHSFSFLQNNDRQVISPVPGRQRNACRCVACSQRFRAEHRNGVTKVGWTY